MTDIRLSHGRDMINAVSPALRLLDRIVHSPGHLQMCLAGVRVRLACHRALGTFHASTSRSADQMPATIMAWLQSWTFRLREIEADRLALLRRATDATAPVANLPELGERLSMRRSIIALTEASHRLLGALAPSRHRGVCRKRPS